MEKLAVGDKYIQTSSLNVVCLKNDVLRRKNISFKIKNYLYKSGTGALSSLRKSLATETPLKIMKNTFYFTLKALFILKIFKFLS